jgi:hypothetical protein
MQRRILIAALSAIAVSAACSLRTVQAASEGDVRFAMQESLATAGWQVDKGDNICGLDDARQLSNPVMVDYDRLLAATPEMKRLKDEKIDPNSSEGIQLRQKAVDRIREKCEALRVQKGYCSVWKAIRHTDNRTVTDVTDSVIALF